MPALRAVVDDDVRGEQAIGDTRGVRHVDDDGSAATRRRRSACSGAIRVASRASISRRVSRSDFARIAGTPISATISYPARAE